MDRVIVLRAFSFEKEGRMGPVCLSYVFMTFKNEETSMGAEFMLVVFGEVLNLPPVPP